MQKMKFVHYEMGNDRISAPNLRAEIFTLFLLRRSAKMMLKSRVEIVRHGPLREEAGWRISRFLFSFPERICRERHRKERHRLVFVPTRSLVSNARVSNQKVFV